MFVELIKKLIIIIFKFESLNFTNYNLILLNKSSFIVILLQFMIILYNNCLLIWYLNVFDFVFVFSLEKLIKSACLNTAQNIISDIDSQNKHFLTLAKRLIEVREENSSESVPYGIF